MSNKVRLINANVADVERIPCFYGDACHSDDVQTWLDEQPTIDAVPVVHGHYGFVASGLQNVPVMLGTCSECHRRIAMYTPTWFECNHYCPNCGAKMDATDNNVGHKDGGVEC